MDDDELRAILARVSSGDLSPEEAAALLGGGTEDGGAEAHGDDGHDGDDRDGFGGDPEREAGEPKRRRLRSPEEDLDGGADFGDVRVVRLRATANRTRVVSDPGVRTVKVSGPHRLHVDGDCVVVENELIDELTSRGRHGAYVRISGLRGGKVSGFRGHETLEVRINPSLSLDFDCDAGTIEVLGATRGLSGRVNAGNAVIEDFDGPFHLAVNAGKLRARGRVDSGDSTIDVNVGKADVVLDDGSSVRIVRSATLGSAEADDDLVGRGDGTLRVTCSLGAVRVHSPEGSLNIKHRMERHV